MNLLNFTDNRISVYFYDKIIKVKFINPHMVKNLFSLKSISLIQNTHSFLLAKNDKNSCEYIAMCGIFPKVRDNSITLCYNVLKDFSIKNYFSMVRFLRTTPCYMNVN